MDAHRQPTARRLAAQAGFSLIEALIALSLFSLIGLAGLSLLETILKVQTGTDGRLERVADIQGTLDRLRLDLMTAEPGSVIADGASLSLEAPSGEAGAIRLYYALTDGRLERWRGPDQAVPLLDAVANLQFELVPADRTSDSAHPYAVDIRIDLAPGPGKLSGTIRATVELAGAP
jgi:general secretion pathway protein J